MNSCLRSALTLLAGTCMLSGAALAQQPVDYVDPFLGTANSRWMVSPGPTMPFGMVQLGPDNQDAGWKAGYDYQINSIMGFSHIHSWTMAGLLTMPATGPLKIVPGTEKSTGEGYRSRIDHATETASPGYYAVTLEDYGIRAELTSTTRAGFHRYTFPKSDSARILFALQFPVEYEFNVVDARFTKVSSTEIEGYSSEQTTGFGTSFNDFVVHFVIRFSEPFDSLGGWVNGAVTRKTEQVAGSGDVGAFVQYHTSAGEVIGVQVGISLVSIEQARLNLATEIGPFGWDFEGVHRQARSTWNMLLGKIGVEGREADKRKFYTNLYRSYCARTIWSDVNGKYMDMNERVRQVQDTTAPVYGCDAFWNTFWNLNQLWELVNPDIALSWVKSLLEINDAGGWLPKGPAGIEYSSVMVGEHGIAMLVGPYQKGIRGFDAEKAYSAMRHVQMEEGRPYPGGGAVGNRLLNNYMKLGYVPMKRKGASFQNSYDSLTSNTLEFAYDDWCVAQMAKALGKEDDYSYFLKRSQNYRNVFDPAVGFVRAKDDNGIWIPGFDPFSGVGMVEGNSWQYTWFVPHDVYGLIDLMGRKEFNRRLLEGFNKSVRFNFNAQEDNFTSFTINHGNQPNMQAAWLFNYSGLPWETQRWTREIMARYYGSTPLDGWLGDEDEGQMGSWFVMSSMGLFEMDGGCRTAPIYEIGSPVFDKIVIHLDPKFYPGREFVIETKNNSPENVYIQSATLNGKPLGKLWLYHADVVKGGTLVLQMGPQPNKHWGAGVEARPPACPTGTPIVSCPFVLNCPEYFDGSADITVRCSTPGAEIRYTLDGTEPTASSALYRKPVHLTQSAIVRARAFRKGMEPSPLMGYDIPKVEYARAEEPEHPVQGLRYAYYEGKFTTLPDFDRLTPVATGECPNFTLGHGERSDNFAYRFSGYLKVDRDGLYHFFLSSDDGSKLCLDGKEIVDNDGTHGTRQIHGIAGLKKGFHSIVVTFFDEIQDQSLELLWSGPEGKRRPIENEALYHSPVRKTQSP